MDDTIEICAGCGKMPRGIDTAGGSFVCARCGGKATIMVNTSNYESVVTELDQKFHHEQQTRKIEEAAKFSVDLSKPKKPSKKKKAAKVRAKPSKTKTKKTKRK